MIKTPGAGKKALVVGLVVAAVACGSAAAGVIPVVWLNLHARLAPVAGTTAAGRFDGTLLVSAGGPAGYEPSDPLPANSRAVLSWRLSLPALRGPMTATLRVRAKTTAPFSRVLCKHCSTTASGRVLLTKGQGLRFASSDAVVVVTAASAMLRGQVKVSTVPIAVASATR